MRFVVVFDVSSRIRLVDALAMFADSREMLVHWETPQPSAVIEIEIVIVIDCRVNLRIIDRLEDQQELRTMEETKVIYHIDDETTPYLVKIPLPSAQVTLKDFKMVLNKQSCNYKYFFKSMDADFG